MSRVKAALSRIFKHGHPDIYEAAKNYAEKRGLSTTDVIGAAVSGYLMSDAEGKDELEEVMKKKRTDSGGGKGDLSAAVDLFKTMCTAMGDMFKTMNEARSSLQSASLIADYKAVTSAASEIKRLGGESGGGSIEDAFATAMIQRMLGGKMPSTKSKKKTGTSEVVKVGEED